MGFGILNHTLYTKDLAYMWPVQVVIESGSGGQIAALNTAVAAVEGVGRGVFPKGLTMSWRDRGGHEGVGNRLLQRRLIGFDREDVRSASQHNLLTQLPLGKHGIASHHTPAQIHCLQQS